MKNTPVTRSVSAILFLALLAGLTACGGTTGTSSDTTAAPNSGTTAEAVEVNPLEALDFGGQKVSMVYKKAGLADNDEFVSEETGDVIDDAVFNRNIRIEEMLNVKLEFIPDPSTDASSYHNKLQSTLLSGDDVYNIITNTQYNLLKLSVQGLLYDMIDAPYIDYEKPWWAVEYMNTCAINANHRYLLGGDITTSTIGNLSCTFFNKSLFNDFFGDPNDLYKLVLDGRWTFDTMEEYVKKGWKDLDGDGVCGMNDIIGMASTASSPTEHFAFPAGMNFVTRDKDGYPVLLTDQTHNVEITEKLYHLLFENEGAFINKDANAINNEYPVMFADGQILFFPNVMGSTAKFRDSKDPYGVIPRPKFDENQAEYKALIHDSVTAFAVPILTKEYDAACAVLEAIASENYKTVVPAYYEVTLKVKYTHDDISSQLIDLIHDSATTDFVYANNYVFNTSGSLGTIQRKLMGARSKDFMSTYETMKTGVATVLEQLIAEDKAK